MRASRFAFPLAMLVFVAALILGVREWARGHPQDMPWTPLNLADRAGRFTNYKIAALHEDMPACVRLLTDGGERFTTLPPVESSAPQCGYANGVRLASGERFSIVPVANVACPVAVGLFLWKRQVLEPAAQRHFGSSVIKVDSFGSYSCRPVRGGREGNWSEHSTADAIDVAGFRLADGTRISIAAHWADQGAKGAFLREIRDGACASFATVLSPDYNALHRDHLHLDQADRGGWSFCR
ncbi:MAG: extensin family protein [Pseudomonadota bacterium]